MTRGSRALYSQPLDATTACNMNDVKSRNKYIHFVFLWLSIFVPPYLVCLLGTALPEFMCLLQSDLKSVGSLFLSYGLGKIVIPVYVWLVGDAVDVTLLCSLSLAVVAVTLSLLAYTTSIVVANVIWWVVGFACGSVNVARYTTINNLWPEANLGHHFISCAFPVTCLVTPPFVSLFVNTHTYEHSQSNPIENNIYNECSTNIGFAFLVASLVAILASAGLLSNFYSMFNDGMAVDVTDKSVQHRQMWPRSGLTVCFYSLMMTLFGSITSCMTTFYSLMVTFGLRSRLHLDVQTTASMTSLFSVCVLAARLVCTCISDRVRPSSLIWVSLCLLLASNGVFIYVRDTSVIALWIITALLGVGAGPMFVSVFTWSKRYLQLSTKLTCMILAFDEIGNLILPFLTSVMVDLYGPDMFIYLGAVVRVFQTLLFIILSRMGPIVTEEI